MRIKKIENVVGLVGHVLKQSTKSDVNTYSANYLNDRIAKVSLVEPTTGEKVWIKKSNNLFPGWTVGKYYGSSNGVLVESDSNSCSDLIPVDFSENNKYHFSNLPTSSNIYISAFDSKRVYVGRTASGIKEDFTFYPSKLSSSGAGAGDANDIKFIAVTYQGTDVTDNTMLNLGTEALPYEPYVKKKILVKNDNDVYDEFYNESGIIESGSNDNGEWIKFADGTMVITQQYGKYQDCTQVFGNFYATYPNVLPDFPVKFVELPRVVRSTLTADSILIVDSNTPQSVSNAGSVKFLKTEKVQQFFYVDVIAIGKWK